MLGSVLKRHPNVHCLIERPEVFRFASYVALHPAVKREEPERVCREMRSLYDEAWELSPGHCRACSAVCRKVGGLRGVWSGSRVCMEQASILRHADKSHQHVLNVELIERIFPGAQYLHLVRDGRDVVASMLRHRGVLRWFTAPYIQEDSSWPHPWFGVESREHFLEWRSWSLAKKCALRWASWVREGRAAARRVGAARWHEMRYERLVGDREEVGDRMFSFLDLPAYPAALAEVRATAVGGWREKLRGSELSDVLEIAGPTLEELGYLAGEG